MKELKSDLCTGCAACVAACPVHCLTMKQSHEGFMYPYRNDSICIECGICESICPTKTTQKESDYIYESYALKLKDCEEIYNSSSGGAFYAVAKACLSKGGIVWGASFEKDFSVKHTYIESISDIERLRKSKYVQSDISESYEKVLDQLKRGRTVLFSGTPCQIVGLNSYLGKTYEKLWLLEIFCHAIPSPLVWKMYLQDRENEFGGKAISVDFRYKDKAIDDKNQLGIAKYGFKNPMLKIQFDNGQEYKATFSQDAYVNGFSNELFTRKSCYNCAFKLLKIKTGADFSIGDFWGAESFIPEFFDVAGVSALNIHSEKGKEIFSYLKDYTNFLCVPLDYIKKQNSVVFISESAHENRDSFFKQMQTGAEDSISTLIMKNLGYFASKPEQCWRFGLFGSFNSRQVIQTACLASNSRLLFQFSNSSLISAMTDNVKCLHEIEYIGNPFRKEMLLADINKTFTVMLNSSLENVDFLVIDFLEERFEVASFGDTYLTISDAMVESNIHVNTLSTIKICEKHVMWKENCLKLISKIKNNVGFKKVVLIKQFLAEKYCQDGEMYFFPEVDDIKRINDYIAKYYEFFEQNCFGIHVIEMKDRELRYSDYKHKHGCHPWHLNENAYRYMANELYLLIQSILEVSNI